MAFSQADFNTTLTEIETRLGYLRGNENAWKYLHELSVWYDQNQTEGGILDVLRLDPGYNFPCPNGRFTVNPYATWSLNIYILPGQTFDREAFIKSIQDAATMAWEDGVAWSRGVADYARSVCDQFTKPDVGALVDTILALQTDVVNPLLDAPNDDWANLGNLNAQWSGADAAAFNEFYLNYNDTLARDGIYTGLVNVGFASAAKLIGGTQSGAKHFVDSILDALDAQLDQWASWDREPPEPADTPPWIADVMKIASSAFDVAADIIPVVGRAAEKLKENSDKAGNLNKLITDIEEVSGKDILPEKTKTIPVKTADEIYTGLTETLHQDYYQAFNDGMDLLDKGGPPDDLPDPEKLAEGSFSGDGVTDQMEKDKEQGDWTLPDIGKNPELIDPQEDSY